MWPLFFKHSHRWKRRSRLKFTSLYAWGNNGVGECEMDVISTWIPTWHRIGSCFMVTWTIFKNYLLEACLTQNRETMTLQHLTTIHLFYFSMCGDRAAWIEIHWNSIWLRRPSHMTSHDTWEPLTALHEFGSVLRRPLDTSFGLTISWSRLLAHMRSGPYWRRPGRHVVITSANQEDTCYDEIGLLLKIQT